MMYAGDEYYGDDVTSPLERPLPTYRRIARQPVREQTKRVKRTARGEPIRDDRPLPMNGTDYHVFGEE